MLIVTVSSNRSQVLHIAIGSNSRHGSRCALVYVTRRTRHTQDGPEADLVDIVDFRTRDCSHSRIRKCNVAPAWPKTRCVTITLPYLLNLSTRTSIETRNQPAYPTTKPVDGGGLEQIYDLMVVWRAKNKLPNLFHVAGSPSVHLYNVEIC